MLSEHNRIDGADLSAVTPEEFTALVKQASSSQLSDAMSDPAVRARVLDEIFSRMGTRYTGDRSTSGVVRWRILGDPDGDEDLYETVFSDGTCTVNRGSSREPRVTISLAAPEFLKLASGNGSPTTMFFSGRLKLSGDIGFAAGLGALFDIPKS